MNSAHPVGWLDPLWSDTIDVIVAASTIAATVLSLIALGYSYSQARKSKETIQAERRRNHERDTLRGLLDLALTDSAPNPRHVWKPGLAYLRTLSPATRAKLPVAGRYFNHRWEEELLPEAMERDEANAWLYRENKTQHLSLGWWTWDLAADDRPERSVLAVIYDELIGAITEIVEQD